MNYCEDCKKFKTNNCRHPRLQKCSGYEPKEKPVENKVIFESRSDLINFGLMIKNSIDEEHMIQTFKSYNIYIRKSVVEEAEEMYKKYKNGERLSESKDFQVTFNILIENLYEAIQYLKAENERLKK